MVYLDRAREQNLPNIEVHGPQSDEFAPSIQHLFKGELPEGWQWVKSTSNSRIAKRVSPPVYYFKEFLSRSRLEWLKSLLRGNRRKRARLQGEILRRNGFNSPVCCCWGRMENRHFMITEGIDAIGMGEFIYDRWRPPLEKKTIKDKRMIIDNLGSTIGHLHKTGIFHGDLRLNNILIYHRDKEVAFYFIDNERNRIYKKIPKYLIEKNLVQVNLIFPEYVTRRDRLRFYKAYNSVYGRFSGKEQNRLMQRVQVRTGQRLKKIALRTHGF